MNIDGWNGIISVSNVREEMPIMDRKEWGMEISDIFINFLEGSKNPVQLIKLIGQADGDIRNFLFARNLKAFVNGVSKNGTEARKIGKMLAESDYGQEYGYVLLKFIESLEIQDKGMILAMLTDAMTKEFISPNDTFRYARLIRDISYSSLLFLKNNVKKAVLYKPSSEEKI